MTQISFSQKIKEKYNFYSAIEIGFIGKSVGDVDYIEPQKIEGTVDLEFNESPTMIRIDNSIFLNE